MSDQNPIYLTREAVGDRLYFWRSAHGGNRCLISAHGAYHNFSGKFDPSSISPNIRVNFFAPHGKMLEDPGLRVIDGGHIPLPSNQTEIYNYGLSKFQSENGETYRNIDNKITGMVNSKNFLDEYLHKLNGNPIPEQDKTTIENAQAAQANVMHCHIVTIRHRYRFGISLRTLIQQINQHAQVTQFYCSFCRNHLLNWRAKAATAQRRP